MTIYDGARRAAALYAALSRHGEIPIDDYERLFEDPSDQIPFSIFGEDDAAQDSRRKARDRAVEDLKAIGIEVKTQTRGLPAHRYLTLSNQTKVADALLLHISPEQNDMRLDLSTLLRKLHPNNGVRFDDGALAKQYMHSRIEIGYNGDFFQGVPYAFRYGPCCVLHMRCVSGDQGFYIDAITSVKVVRRKAD